MRYTPDKPVDRLAASKHIGLEKKNIMQHQMLLDVAIVITPIALIFFPEFVGLIVQCFFNTRKQEL
jgi:hypothetical protein